MTAPALHYERFASGTRTEWMMRIGEAQAPAILFVPPLLEEMNRTRALIAAVMRALAAQGLGCWLPDLGGTGESETRLEAIRWEDWRHDVATAALMVAQNTGEPPLVASLRGGVLIDDAAQGRAHWRFAPVTGASIARDMDRASLAGGVDWAGYHASSDLRQAIASASPAPVTPLRTVRLATDAGTADAKVKGPALWRRSEPATSPALSSALTDDLLSWSRTCGS